MAYTTINKHTDNFNTKIYSGNGSTQSLTGVGFQPDFTWIKQRTGSTWHNLYDAVRGATKAIASNDSGAEGTRATGLTAFDSDGFSLGSDSNANAGSGSTYASWNWKANGAGSTNYDGTTNSTVSVNTTAGFSIVKYVGADAVRTVGHGLGVKPNMIIVKRLGSTGAWQGYHSSLGATKYLRLDSTGASDTSTARWNDTEPTSSVFTLGTSAHVNERGDYIAYCFAEKTGYSKIGSYVSNNSSNGVFVYTGFKPKFILIKAVNEAVDWRIYDSERLGYNNKNYYLEPNNNTSEGTTDSGSNWDMLSNGFKFYTSEAEINGGAGNNYIYMAFGQSLVGSNNVPCTAR